MENKKAVILTKEQATILRHQAFAADSYFNPFLSKNMDIMISEEEINQYEGKEYDWLKEMAVEEITVLETEPDYSRSDLVVDAKYPVLYKNSDFIAKTVTIVYLVDGKKKEVVEKLLSGATAKGYDMNLETKIKSIETK
jgi:hypothetical protein